MVATFDSRQRELDGRRFSSGAKTAGKKASKSAAVFEKALLAAASAAAELTADAADLADALRVTDEGIWPSRGSVSEAVRSRVVAIFGSNGIKLEGFGSSAKPSQSLTSRFDLNQER